MAPSALVAASPWRPRRRGSASVREICLVATAGPAPVLAAGARMTRSGRVYRVEATQEPDRPDRTTGYLHLSAVPPADAPGGPLGRAVPRRRGREPAPQASQDGRGDSHGGPARASA
jgi:hypothetical protein